MRRFSGRSIARLIAPTLAVLLLPTALPAAALSIVPGATADSVGITPLGWSVIGLDSNNVNVGPDEFPVGARYCTSTPVSGTLTATWQWTATGSTVNDSLIRLANPSAGYLAQSGFTAQSGIVAGQTCYDAYWNVKLTRATTTYWKDRGYVVNFSDASGSLGGTDPNRRIFVEKLVSQNRNTVTSVTIDGGGNTVTIGNTYQFTVTGATSTSYDQLTFSSIFPATTFQMLDSQYTYSNASGLASDGNSDQTYVDACSWRYMYDVKEEPGQCVGVGGAGGSVVAHYTVRVSPDAAPGLVNVKTLIYDFSGSSFHYNSDYGSGFAVFAVNVAAPVQKTVRYHSNEPAGTISGTLPVAESVTVDVAHTVKSPGTMALSGYVFGGWNTEADGTGTAYVASDVLRVPNADVNLYAVWIPVQHWGLAYNLQGGITVGDTSTETTTIAIASPAPGESITVTGVTPSKTGYSFSGWNTEADGTGSTYAPLAVVPNPGTETLLVLNAQWNAGPLAVTYDENCPAGSQVATDTQTVGNYAILGISSDTMTGFACTGKTFAGWSDGGGNSYPPGYVYTGTSALTLFAQWLTAPTPTYIVTYLGNGSTGGVQPVDSASYAAGDTTTSLANTFTRTGYTFAGWNTNETGTGTAYAVGATHTFNANDLVLYAIWTPNAPVINVKSGPADSTTIVARETVTAGEPIDTVTVDPAALTGPIDTYTVSCSPALPGNVVVAPVAGDSVTSAAAVSISGTVATSANPGTYNCVISAWGPGGSSTVSYTLVVLPIKYNLTTAATGQGSLNVGPGTQQFDSGTVVSLVATPAHGWHFVRWTGSCTGSSNPLSVPMDATKSCTAVFEINPLYLLTVTVVGQGSVSPGTQLFDPLTEVMLTATPAAGWFFASWSGACSGTAACKVTMTEAKSVEARFIQGLTVTTATTGSGTVQSTQPTGTVLLPGTLVTLTATPTSGWQFAGWSGSCSGAANPVTVTLDVSKACTATFTEIPVAAALVAANDIYRMRAGETLRVPASTGVLRNDGSMATRVELATKPKHGSGTLTADGKLVYKPKKGFTGIDTFTYRAFDDKGQSVTATVRIVVAPRVPTVIKTGR